jgi:hypothetical protein
MDHSKFETLEEGLKGATLVDKLITYFKTLNNFKTIKLGLPVMSYATCIDLEILMKEMTDYEIHSKLQWKEIVGLVKTKYNFPGLSKLFPAIDKKATNQMKTQSKSNDEDKGPNCRNIHTSQIL